MTVEELLVYGKSHCHSDHAKILLAELINKNPLELLTCLDEVISDEIVNTYRQEIEALEKDFDPNVHLAVMQESVDGVEANKVVMVLQKGYKLGSKVLRASMVKVSC